MNSYPTNRRELHHYRFLCAALTGPSPAALRLYLDHECWDWESLAQIASDELVLPLLYDRLIGAIPLDAPVSEALREIRDLHAERNQIILDELRVVAELANQLGIEPVVLKGGAHLLAGLYPAPSDRYLVDLDLLAPEASIPPLVEHLLRNGYAFDTTHPVGVDCHHETGLRRPGRPLVELHRSLGMGRARRLLPAADVIRDSVATRHRGAAVRLPSAGHLLVHHAIHAQLNNCYRLAVWPTLREAYDCHLLVGRLAHLPPSGIVALQVSTVQEMLSDSRPRPLPRLGLHRRLLRTAPWLRFIDPYYFVRSSLQPRLHRLRDLGKSGNGLRYALQTPFRRSFYRNVLRELF